MWFTIFQQAAGETGPETHVETEAAAQAEAPVGGPIPEAGSAAPVETAQTGNPADGVGEVLGAVMEPVQPDVAAPRPTDAIEALTETTERATEAATEFVGWVGSGQLEALFALVLIVGFSALMFVLRLAALKGFARMQVADTNSVLAVLQRIVSRFHKYFMVAIAFALTDVILPLPGAVSGFTKVFFVLAAVLQVAEWVQEFAISAVRRSVHRGGGDSKALASAFNIIKYFISMVIWAVALLLIMSNVGMDVTALLAGLGIGGIAIGIAAQGVFRDLFSSLSIVIDKPFQIGDTVRYGTDTWGAIEEIGLKTTRIRSRSGEQIIISNTNLLDHEIHNMQRMARRRIETGFGVVYQTSPDLAEQIPGLVAELVKTIPGVEFDRCGLAAFGPSSLDYGLVFYSLNPDFNRSMAARSRVLLALYRLFREQGITFAYPTQTLYIEGTTGTKSGPRLHIFREPRDG